MEGVEKRTSQRKARDRGRATKKKSLRGVKRVIVLKKKSRERFDQVAYRVGNLLILTGRGANEKRIDVRVPEVEKCPIGEDREFCRSILCTRLQREGRSLSCGEPRSRKKKGEDRKRVI